MKNLHQQVLELLPQCIEDRRWLHRHAELSFREYKTADYLEQALCELEGLELSRPTPTSVMASFYYIFGSSLYNYSSF